MSGRGSADGLGRGGGGPSRAGGVVSGRAAVAAPEVPLRGADDVDSAITLRELRAQIADLEGQVQRGGLSQAKAFAVRGQGVCLCVGGVSCAVSSNAHGRAHANTRMTRIHVPTHASAHALNSLIRVAVHRASECCYHLFGGGGMSVASELVYVYVAFGACAVRDEH